MSFILDALKKSEAERQRRAGPALLEMRVVRPQRRLPTWVWVGGAILLLVNLLGVLWLAMRPATNASATQPSPAVQTSAAQPYVIAATPTPTPALKSNAAAEAPYVVAGDDTAIDSAADLAPAIGDDSAAPASRLRRYSDMASELPALRLDFHVYSPTVAARYAFINMHKVREGETTAEGMRVIAITRDGVELSYRNTDFLLSSEQR
jgi:general secretion pathway protein B